MSSSANVGYIRVSTVDQNTDCQLANLDVKLDRAFVEKASAKSTERPQLQEMLAFIREGDFLYIHSMDRLARNLADLLNLVTQITTKGVTIHFVKESLTFSPKEKANPMSKLMLSMMGAFAEFERALILERQREGIAQAKARGAYKGRKPISSNQIEEAREMIAAGKAKTTICKELGIGRTTLYKYLKTPNPLARQAS